MHYFFKIILALILSVNLQFCISQPVMQMFKTIHLNDSMSVNKFDLRIESCNFFKNNEYFTDFVDGYTLIGYFIQPRLVYRPLEKLSIETGIHVLQYAGIDNLSSVLPLFRVHYKPNEKFNIVMGNIYGTANHSVADILFRSEMYFTNNVENGLQFLFDTKLWKADIWLNWEKFIFKNSTYQEKFTVGLNNQIKLGSNLSIPLQMIATHRGGQINTTTENIQSLFNLLSGISYRKNLYSNKFRSFTISANYVLFNDMSPSKQLRFIEGYGVYSYGIFQISDFSINLSHWYGKFFISNRGNPLYQSVSDRNSNYFERNRAIISSSIFYEKLIFRKIWLGVSCDTYTDLYNHSLDYSYGIYLKLDLNFSLSTIKIKKND